MWYRSEGLKDSISTASGIFKRIWFSSNNDGSVYGFPTWGGGVGGDGCVPSPKYSLLCSRNSRVSPGVAVILISVTFDEFM